ncbi:hypothetical protein SBDP1_1280011 [Syntrophobacter sp. SbD1]|nr:hypothetical protein SBDP1_1280011 [Syntrophobacter sp. SbD1]
MNEKLLNFYEAAKALITYIDQEYVFDKSADMGCGGFDTYQSETFYNLIAKAKEALGDFESEIKVPECP